MSEAVIKVENLGKKYLIGHQKQEKYTALRDVISNTVSSILKPNNKAETTTEEFWALKDINFEIKQGDRVGIIGRNGAGKSTLLKVLSRITEPTTGQIKIKGRVASLLEVGTGFHPELTGRENIFLNGAILGMSRIEIKKKFDEIVAFAEVEKFLDTPVKRYSSGMYVRLAFAVAAHLEPEILIVDEVLAVGDAQFQNKCLGKMKEVGDEGRTVIFVSHQMGMISQLCNQAIFFERGTLKRQGQVETIVGYYLQKTINNNKKEFVNRSTKSHKDIYISNIEPININNESGHNFGHLDRIRLKINCVIHQYSSNTFLGITVKDKLGRKVFSSQIELKLDNKYKNINHVTSIMTIPVQLLTPGQYCIFAIVHIPKVNVIDTVDDVCWFTISDMGSEFAQYEGIDYGCIFADCEWKINFSSVNESKIVA